MSINEECRRFLSRSKEGFDNPDFKHAQYLVDLLPELNSGNVSGKYQELEEKEKEVDNLVGKIVGNRFEEFTSLLNKPMIYGEKYDNIKKIVSTSRKKIKHSKELLAKKNNNLKGYLFNSVHNKEILSVLEKVEKCNSLFIQIDALMKNESFYEMSLSILELRKELDSFDRSLKDCAVIKHLYENERYKTQEAYNLIQRFLRRFFFFFEYEFAIKSYASKADGGGFQFDKINLDNTSNLLNDNLSRKFFTLNQTQTETINDVLNNEYGVDLEGFKYFENKINQIRVVLQSAPKGHVFDYVEDEYRLVEPEVFDNIHVMKYIDFSLAPGQFNKYLELICKAEDLLEQESFASTKNLDIMNLFLAIRSAELSKILLQIFSDYYGNMKKNLHDSLLLVQMFLLKSVWASQKEDVVDHTFQDNDESNASIYHNLTMVQDYQSLLSLTSLGDNANEKIIAVEKRKDLLAVYNYNPATTRNLIQLFKEILLFQTIFMRKNVMLQLMLTNIKENTSDLPIIHIRETWKEFILELDSLFDKVFMLAKIDFTLFSNPKDSHILFEASLIPGSPFYDELPKTKAAANQIYGQGNKNSLLDDFMIQKFIDLLGVNFMYIPFVLSVIYGPIMKITDQINNIYEHTPIKELFQSQTANNVHHHRLEIIAFFDENITKFLLLFKLEYVKLINGAINTNKPAALQPEKNMTPNQPAPATTSASSRNKPNAPKEEAKKDEKEINKEEKKEDKDLPRESSRTTKTEVQRKESLEMQAPLEKAPKRTKFDVKSAYLKLKYNITGLVQLSYNVNMLPSIAYYLPADKQSHMLDLLTWSMNIAHLEISDHLKGFLKGYLVSDILSDPRESEYLKCDPGIFKFVSYLNQSFPYLKYADQIPSMKDHMKFVKNKYRTYLLGETLINEEKLINNEKHIILIISTIENLEVFLKACDYVFWNLILKLPAQDIENVFAEKVSAVPVKSDGKNSKPEAVKEAIAKLKAKVEAMGIQGFLSRFQNLLATIKEPANVYRQLPEETGELGIVRYFHRFNQLFELVKKCLSCLKQELHLRAFCHLIRQEKRAKITMENNPLELSGHNFTSLYRDVFAIFEPIKSSIGPEKMDFIFNDYLDIVVKIIKQAFLRSQKISRPYIKTYLQNLQSLEMNLKKLEVLHETLEGKENPILKMKRFLSLFLLEEKELLNIVKNKKKIKPKHIELYVELQNQANEIKLDQKQEMERVDALNKLLAIAKERQEQLKSNPKAV